MESTQQLKDQARSLERVGKEQAALDLYSRIQQLEKEADPAVLFRMGNLQQRLGQEREALDSYARTLELLIGAGLRNSALAVCRRILDIAPEHEEAGLRLAELSAEAGYADDARTAFLGFAERMEARGDQEAARRALQSYLAFFPEDVDTRRMLIARLRQQGRVEQAVGELRSLETLLRRRGAAAEAAAVVAEIRRLDPAAAASPNGTDPAEFGSDDLDLLSLEPEGPAHGAAAADPDAPEELDILPTVLEDAGGDPDAISPLEGLEPTHAGADWFDGTGAADDTLPFLGDDLPDGEPVTREPASGEAGPDEVDELPLLGSEFVPEPEEDSALLRRRVEEAARGDDPSRLVDALLALGRHLERQDPARSREVFQRVLDLDPGNREARRALSDPGL